MEWEVEIPAGVVSGETILVRVIARSGDDALARAGGRYGILDADEARMLGLRVLRSRVPGLDPAF